MARAWGQPNAIKNNLKNNLIFEKPKTGSKDINLKPETKRYSCRVCIKNVAPSQITPRPQIDPIIGTNSPCHGRWCSVIFEPYRCPRLPPSSQIKSQDLINQIIRHIVPMWMYNQGCLFFNRNFTNHSKILDVVFSLQWIVDLFCSMFEHIDYFGAIFLSRNISCSEIVFF